MKKFVMKSSIRQEIPENPVRKLLRVLAILIYVAGFCYGAMWLSRYDAWDGTISAWFGAFFLGSVVLGLSEVIQLLHQIRWREYVCAWQEVPEAPETEGEDADS